MRKFGPKGLEDVVGRTCPACHQPFVVGDFTALVPLGPGADLEAQMRARAGLPYTAVAVEVHWDCAGATE